MRKILQLSIIFLLVFSACLQAQDLPLFSQKLTNSFLYNPSMAGNTLGSITYSHRQFWNGLDQSPSSNFISFHVPFAYHRFGAGANIYQEKIGVVENLFISGAFAYHINFTDEKSLSMGASVEYNNLRLNTAQFLLADVNDPVLMNFDPINNMDFSFGMSYSAKYLRLGLAANRLGNFIGVSNQENRLAQFYSAYAGFFIPMADGRDVIEPILSYRSQDAQLHNWDAGVYYTFNNLLTLGGAYRDGNVVNMTLAVRFANRYLVGYSHELFADNLKANIGSSNEFTLRVDLRDDNYYKNPRNSRKIMNQSLAFRKKTLSKSGNASSPKFKKKLRKNYHKNPNYRMNSSKKLQKNKRQNFKKNKRRSKRNW